MAFNKKAFAISVVGTVTFLTILGSTAGTLAWYAYSTSTLLSYVGTSVQKSGLLGIGIVTDDTHYISAATIDRYDLEELDMPDGHTIVWTTSSNGLDVQVIKEYLMNSPYAYNKLSPVSSHSRAIDASGEFKLYEAPEYGKVYNEKAADKKDYVVLPFAFRILDENDQPVKDKKIWLTDAVVEASAGQYINRAVRMHVKNQERQFLVNPSDDTTGTKYTQVGGLLDLDGDGTYDFNASGSQEYFYGEFDTEHSSISYASTEYGIDYDHADLENVNHTPYEEQSTFLAKHNEHAKIASFSTDYVKRAYYYPFGQVNPSIISGSYTEGDTGIPISKTDATYGIGYATLTIYLEGWDFSVVDKEIDHSFNLGLTFEINKL